MASPDTWHLMTRGRCATTLVINDKVVATGSGAEAAEGGPAEALTWLANHLNGRGKSLNPGEVCPINYAHRLEELR